MALRETLRAKWFRYSAFCVLVWGPYNIVSKLGSREIPAPAMQYLFTWGSLPVMLGLLLARRLRLERSGKGISYGVITGILSGIGGLGLFAAFGSGGNTTVVTTTTSLYPMVTVILAVIILRERLTWVQVLGLVFTTAALILFSL